ncbi:MAG: protein kinase [Planctomycetota bacterium]
MAKLRCYDCGKEVAFKIGMTTCPHCDSVFSDVQIKVATDSIDAETSIDTAKASRTVAAPQSTEPSDDDGDFSLSKTLNVEEIGISSSKTALAADLGYVDNPNHLKTLDTPEQAYASSTTTKSSAIPPRTIAEDDSGSEIRDYRIESELGQGSFGTVYRAIQVPLDRSVAIKLLKPLPLPPSTEGDQSRVSRLQQENRMRDEFLREAQFTGKLEHPNIVPIHDIGIVSGGQRSDRPFYVMKEIKGISWQDLIDEKTREENLEIFKRVVDAIGFSHSRDILHCDLKPENVMLGEFGEVLVVDWGQAINTNQLETYRPGGSPAYCSPEMAQYWCDFAENPHEFPKSASLIGPRSDVYLLGAILFQLVTGKAPHFGRRGETPADVMRRAARNEIRRYDDFVDDELMQIALRAIRVADQPEILTVTDLQEQLKSYEDRKQSIDIRDRAFDLLEEAERNSDYETFQKAKFGFEESIELWDKNPTAKSGLQATRLKCAKLALGDQNFDLGLEMLSVTDTDEEVQIKSQLRAGKRSRDQRKKLVFALSLAFAGAVLLGGGLALFLGQKAISERRNANLAKQEAKEERLAADKAKQEAEVAVEAEKKAKIEIVNLNEQKKDAVEAKSAAIEAKVAAEELRNKAVEAAQAAEEDRIAANEAKAAAEQAEEAAKEAKNRADEDKLAAERAKERAIEAQKLLLYKSYISAIEQKINSGDFNAARQLLDRGQEADRQSFEWQRLNLLAHPEVTGNSLYPDESLKQAELSGDRSRLVLCFEDRIEIRNPTDLLAQPIVNMQFQDLDLGTIGRVAISKDGSTLAIASEGTIHLLDAETGDEKFRPAVAQSLGITHIEFSQDGNRFLSVGSASSVNRKNEHELMVFELIDGQWSKLPNPLFKGELPRPTYATFSGNGRRIITSSRGEVISEQKAYVLELNDKNTFEWIKPWKGRERRMRTGFVTSIFADDAGQQVISSFNSQSLDGVSNQIVVWNVDESDGTSTISTLGFPTQSAQTGDYPQVNPAWTAAVNTQINSLDYNGDMLLAAGENRQLLYWDGLSDGEFSKIGKDQPKRLDGHGKTITNCGILNAGSKFLSIAGNENPEILLTDTNRLRPELNEVKLLENENVGRGSSPSCYHFDANKNQIFIGNDQGLVSVNSLDDVDQSLLKFEVAAWRNHFVTRSSLFALSSRDELFRYNLSTGELESILTTISEFDPTEPSVEKNGRIASFEVSQNGKVALIQRQNLKQEFEIWDLVNQTRKIVSFADRGTLKNNQQIPILKVSDDGQWIVGGRVSFFVWKNDGSFVSKVEADFKQTISSIRFFVDSAKIAVGTQGRLRIYDLTESSPDQPLKPVSYRISGFPASVGKPNVVSARTINGEDYLLIRRVFKTEKKQSVSGLNLIQIGDDAEIVSVQEFPVALQGIIASTGKVICISLNRDEKGTPGLVGFDIAAGKEYVPRDVLVPPRYFDGRASQPRRIFSEIYESSGEDLIVSWAINNRRNTVSIDQQGNISNLCVIGSPVLDSIGLAGEQLITFDNGNVRFWNFDPQRKSSVSPGGSLMGNFRLFNISPDGKTAFAALNNGSRVGLVDLQTRKWKTDVNIQDSTELTTVAWMSDSQTLALGFSNGRISFLQGDQVVASKIEAAETPITQLRYSEDGSSLVFVQDGIANVVRKEDDRWIQVVLQFGSGDEIRTADVSADGNRAVTGSASGRVVLWNTESKQGSAETADSTERELLTVNRNFQSSVREVRFENDDSFILTFESESPTRSALQIPAK